jgi:hypothetical protein
MAKRIAFWSVFTVLVGVTGARAADVVINEVFYDPLWTPDNDHEWIELYNTSGSAVDLGGWIVGDGADTTDEDEGYYVIPGGTSISGGGYLILCRRADSLNAHWGSVIPPGVPILQFEGSSTAGQLLLANGGDDIHLYSSSLVEIDRVWYGDGGDVGPIGAAPDVTAGHSIGRYPDGSDSGDCSVDFRDYSDPSPGKQNPPPVGLSTATWGKIKAMFSVAPGQRKSPPNPGG